MHLHPSLIMLMKPQHGRNRSKFIRFHTTPLLPVVICGIMCHMCDEEQSYGHRFGLLNLMLCELEENNYAKEIFSRNQIVVLVTLLVAFLAI